MQKTKNNIISVIPKPNLFEKLLLFPIEIANSISQKDYFETLEDMIRKTNNEIIMMGYDTTFMNQDIIKSLLNSFAFSNKKITAILPNNLPQNNYFYDFSRLYSNFKISKHKYEMQDGFMIIDNTHLAVHDYTRSSTYLQEINEGIPYRFIRAHAPSLVEYYKNIFNKHLNDLTKQ